jgi:hypothetical protein
MPPSNGRFSRPEPAVRAANGAAQARGPSQVPQIAKPARDTAQDRWNYSDADHSSKAPATISDPRGLHVFLSNAYSRSSLRAARILPCR